MIRLLGLALALTVGACAHTKIGSTEIDDTPENREILDLIDAYHRAVEARDTDAVLAMVSPAYYEDNGNTDRADDYDFRGLSDSLKSDFDRTKTMQLEIRVDDIVFADDEQSADAFILFTFRGQAELPTGKQWKTMTDRARLRFSRQGPNGKWLISAGL